MSELHELYAWAEKLNGFNNAQEIREFLREEGIKGHRNLASECPIARLLKAKISTLDHIGVVLVNDDALDYGEYGEKAIYWVDAVADFIHRFDYGSYPELDLTLQYQMEMELEKSE